MAITKKRGQQSNVWTGPRGSNPPPISPTRALRSNTKKQEDVVSSETLPMKQKEESDRKEIMNDAGHDEQEVDKSKDTTTSCSADDNDDQQEKGDGKIDNTSDTNEYSDADNGKITNGGNDGSSAGGGNGDQQEKGDGKITNTPNTNESSDVDNDKITNGGSDGSSAGGGNDDQQETGDGKITNKSNTNESSDADNGEKTNEGSDRESASDMTNANPNNNDGANELVDTDDESVNYEEDEQDKITAKKTKSNDSIPQGTEGNKNEKFTNMSDNDNADDKASEVATNENKRTERGRNASENNNADDSASDEDDNNPPTRRKNVTKADFDKLNRTIEVAIHPSHLVLICGIVVNTSTDGEEYFQLTSKVNHSVRQMSIVIEILNNFIGNPGQVESRTAPSMHNDLPHYRLAHLVSDTAHV